MFDVVILSLVQSLTEFLPISSSGHLALFKLLGISQQTLLMDITLHAGTLIAVVFYFRRDLSRLLKGFFSSEKERHLLLCIAIATIPSCLCGYFLASVINFFHVPLILAFTAIFWGTILWWVDKYAPKNKILTKMSYKEAFFIGCFQVLALVPGTSRSGITITSSRALGFSRTESAKFSMLLSIPTILLGTGYAFFSEFSYLQSQNIKNLLYGFIFSSFFGLLVIWGLMKWIQKSSFFIFAFYRIVLGIFLVFWYFLQ